jgi:hypothetical protein
MRTVSPSPDPRSGGHGRQATETAVLDGMLERVTFCPRRPGTRGADNPVTDDHGPGGEDGARGLFLRKEL